MPNGDIVSGTSDGMIRVFSNSEERWASEVDLKEYESQVSSQTINKWVHALFLFTGVYLFTREQVGDLKQSDIKGPEVLNQPGADIPFLVTCLRVKLSQERKMDRWF